MHRWNHAGRLRRGFPRYLVARQRVSKRQYERACSHEPTLPRINAEQNAPSRQMPEEVREGYGNDIV
jgi:hypothetical protein